MDQKILNLILIFVVVLSLAVKVNALKERGQKGEAVKSAEDLNQDKGSRVEVE